MKKGFMFAIVAVIILALAVPVALALTDGQKAELRDLYEQEYQLRLEVVDKQVETGLITPEEAESIKEQMAENWEFRQERMNDGVYLFGRGGGRGVFGRRGGGCGRCPNY